MESSDDKLLFIKPTVKQTFIGIWLHDNRLSDDEKYRMKLGLSRTFYYYRIFDDMGQFTTYISDGSLVAKVFLIISHEELYTSCVAIADSDKEIFQKSYVYLPTVLRVTTEAAIFTTSCKQRLFTQLSKDILEFTKVENSPNSDANEIRQESQARSTYQMNRISLSIGVFNRKYEQLTPIRHFTRESLNFLRFLTMVDILIQIPYKREELTEMWMACRDLYKDNNGQLQLDYIDELETNYNACKAIKYYTDTKCLSRVVNQVCHTENMQKIFKFRVYIADVHNQIVRHYEEGIKNGIVSYIVDIYRGKPLSGSVLQQLIDNIDGFIFMNGFLSTTVDREVALQYAGDEEQINKGHKNAIFLLKIEEKVRQPYAYIGNCSSIKDENEVLFSLGTIWRIKSVAHNKNPCEIELSSCDTTDLQLGELRKKYTEKGCSLSTLGDISRELGEDAEAKWFYEKRLEQDSLDNKARSQLHQKIGMIQKNGGNPSEALYNLEIAASLLQPSNEKLNIFRSFRSLCKYDDQLPLIAIYNNMGLIHEENDRFDKAVYYYKSALNIKHGSASEVATVHNNLGRLYYRHGDYKKAREHHKKAIELIDECHLHWIEFKKNLDSAEKRCQHLANRNHQNPMPILTSDESTHPCKKKSRKT